MRALHLVYLRGPGGKKLRYYPTEFEPLIIPWWFSGSDREIIIAFYQQVLGDEPLPRVEVDWYRSLVPADRTFLQHVAEKRRSTEHLVVVKVRRQGVDLRDVLTHPDLQPFPYVAVTCDHSLPNETFGRISELTGFVSQTAEDLYEELAADFSLRDDGPDLLAPLIQTLLNPILVVEAYNALIDVQAERVEPSEYRNSVYRRILLRLLRNVSPAEAIALAAFALRGREGFDLAFREPERPNVLLLLQSRLVLVNDQLTRWTRWLCLPEFASVLAEWNRDESPQSVPFPSGTGRILRWLKNNASLSLDDEFDLIEEWLETGKLAEARNALEEIEIAALPDIYTNYFYNLAGRLRKAEERSVTG